MRFLSSSALKHLDKLMMLLSFLYLLFYMIEPATEAHYPFIVVGILNFLVILAKHRTKVMYAALAYAYFSLIMTQIIMNKYEIEFNPFYLTIILIAYILTTMFKLQTNFITGFLVGYWLLFFYKGYELYQEEAVHPILRSFSAVQSDEILYTTILLLIISLIFMIIGKSIEYDYTGNLVENIDYLLFLLSIGYVLTWINMGFSKEIFPIMFLYIVISYTSFKGKYQESIGYSSVAYAGISLVFFHVISETYGFQDYYITIIGPLLVLLLAYFFKFSTYLPSGILFAYWAWLLYALREQVLQSWGEAFSYLYKINLFKNQSQKLPIDEFNIFGLESTTMVIVIILFSGIGYTFIWKYVSDQLEKTG